MMINPLSSGRKNLPAEKTENNKRVLGQTLARRLSEYVSVDGESMSIAQAISNRLIDIALFAENNKDATSAAKLIFERVEGRAAIMTDDKKEEIPAVTFRLKNADAGKLKQLAETSTPIEVEQNDKIVVQIDDEPDMEF